jgi:hypothetical protein
LINSQANKSTASNNSARQQQQQQQQQLTNTIFFSAFSLMVRVGNVMVGWCCGCCRGGVVRFGSDLSTNS